MLEYTEELLSKLINYLSEKDDFVSAGEIVKEGVLNPASVDEAAEAAGSTLPFLELKENQDKLFRLSRSFEGYRAIFAYMEAAQADIYGFLGSNYTRSVVDGDFIKEALERIQKLPHYRKMEAKYPAGSHPGEAVVLMLGQSPGFDALATMFHASPHVAEYLLFPETLSRYELTHLKAALDLAFASDMLKHVPPATEVTIKYEIKAKGKLNLEAHGGTGIP